jgi:hypothetical protein
LESIKTFPAVCQVVSILHGNFLALTFLDVLCKELARKDVMEWDDHLLELRGWFVLGKLFLNHTEHFFRKD